MFFIITAIIMTVAILAIYKIARALDLALSLPALVGCGVCALLINFLSIPVAPFLTEYRLIVLGVMVLSAAIIITSVNHFIIKKKGFPKDQINLSSAKQAIASKLPKMPKMPEMPKLAFSRNKGEEDAAAQEELVTAVKAAILSDEVVEATVSEPNADSEPITEFILELEPEPEAEAEEEIPEPEVETEPVAEEEIPEPEVETEPVAEEEIPEPEPEIEAEPEVEEEILEPEPEIEAEPEVEEEIPEPEPEIEAEPVAEEEIPEPEPEVEAEPVAEEEIPEPEPEVEAEPVAEEEIPEPEPEAETEPVAEEEIPEPKPEVETEPVAEEDIPETEAEIETEPVAEEEIPEPEPEVETEPEPEVEEEIPETPADIDEKLAGTSSLDDILDYAFELKGSSDWTSALKAYNYALDQYREDGYAPFLVLEIVNIHKDHGRYDDAIQCFYDALEIPAVAESPDMLAEFEDSMIYLEVTREVLKEENQPDTPFFDIPKDYMSKIESIYNERKTRSI
ncbi:hypothetical protein [Anaerovibrio sp. RM50]|uniref:hypothetical protein n=1 Tax=Anaerovibrio sp. RM50 TaxID=1200557 RepID=UPI0004810E7B|nr:hypothetical protein [Anaerovibrio sp. RM50]